MRLNDQATDKTNVISTSGPEPTAPMNRAPARHAAACVFMALAGLFGFDGTAAAQGGLGTGGVRDWLLDNIVPLLILLIALLLLWFGGGRGEHSQVMRRLLGVVVALGVLGLAVTGAGEDIGTWIANLFRA
jgi:hypothetical protein